jgi:hypothetical protein
MKFETLIIRIKKPILKISALMIILFYVFHYKPYSIVTAVPAAVTINMPFAEPRVS